MKLPDAAVEGNIWLQGKSTEISVAQVSAAGDGSCPHLSRRLRAFMSSVTAASMRMKSPTPTTAFAFG
jgi:hypothetical protein